MVSTNLLRNELKKSLQLKINFIICEMVRIPNWMNDTHFVRKFFFIGWSSPTLSIKNKTKKKQKHKGFFHQDKQLQGHSIKSLLVSD